MDVSLAVHVLGSIVMASLGIAVALVRPRGRANSIFAAYATSFGLATALGNLGSAPDLPTLLWFTAASFAVMDVAVIARWFRVPEGAGPAPILGLTLAIGVPLVGLVPAVGIVLLRAYRTRDAPPRWRSWRWVSGHVPHPHVGAPSLPAAQRAYRLALRAARGNRVLTTRRRMRSRTSPRDSASAPGTRGGSDASSRPRSTDRIAMCEPRAGHPP